MLCCACVCVDVEVVVVAVVVVAAAVPASVVLMTLTPPAACTKLVLLNKNAALIAIATLFLLSMSFSQLMSMIWNTVVSLC